MCNVSTIKIFTVTKDTDDSLIVMQKDNKDTLNIRIKHSYMNYDIDLDREAIEAVHKFLGSYLENSVKKQSFPEPSIEEVPTFERAC